MGACVMFWGFCCYLWLFDDIEFLPGSAISAVLAIPHILIIREMCNLNAIIVRAQERSVFIYDPILRDVGRHTKAL